MGFREHILIWSGEAWARTTFDGGAPKALPPLRPTDRSREAFIALESLLPVGDNSLLVDDDFGLWLIEHELAQQRPDEQKRQKGDG